MEFPELPFSFIIVPAFSSLKSGGAVNLKIIGKVFPADSGQKVFENMKLLWKNGFSKNDSDDISMPEPIAFLTSYQLLLQENVPGEPVKVLIKESPEKEHFIKLAHTLAKLHNSSIIPERTFRIKHHLLRCHPKHPFLSMACPKLEKSIDDIVDKAYQFEEAVEGIPFTPLHGDFHLGQLHLENGNAWLLDFDALSYGDPASDLGNVLVFLQDKARKKPAIYDHIHLFLDEYFALTNHSIGERVPTYMALTHLRRACKSLRKQKEGWQSRAERMIKQGVDCIDHIGPLNLLLEKGKLKKLSF